MSISDVQLHQVIEKLFETYDKNRNGFLELKEITQMINITLRHSQITQKFTIQDAHEFVKLADKNKDEKISKDELFQLFKRTLNRA